MNGHTCLQIQSCMHIKMTVFVLIMQSEASVQQSRFIYQLTLSSFIWKSFENKSSKTLHCDKSFFYHQAVVFEWLSQTRNNIHKYWDILIHWMHWLSETDSVAMLKWPEVCSHGTFSFNFQSFMNVKETLDSVNFKSESSERPKWSQPANGTGSGAFINLVLGGNA